MRNLLILLSFLAVFVSTQEQTDTNADQDIDSLITHNGKCRKDMPTMKIGDLLLNQSNYDQFVKENELFVLGVSDSSCQDCCQSEPLLAYIMKLVRDGTLQYQGKEIKVARINTFDRESLDYFEARGMFFATVPKVFINYKGNIMKYEQDFNRWEFFVHQLNRILYPVVPLKTEEQVIDFLKTADQGVYSGDYNTPLLKKFDSQEVNTGVWTSEYRYVTRVVGFFYGKEDYKSEIKGLKGQAQFMSSRDNLRIGMVTDKKLIMKLKKKHEGWFMDVGLSNLLLRRYDGELFKLDMSSIESDYRSYINFINRHTSKPVDQLNREAYQFMETAQMPMYILFIDTNGPNVKESKQLVQNMQQVAPVFEHLFKVFIADTPEYLNQRRLLGVTWPELPSMAFNTLEHNVLPYPRGRPMDKESLTVFFKNVALAKDDSLLATEQFSVQKQDYTIAEHFLPKSLFTHTSRVGFPDEVLDDGADALVYFYSTENLSLKQRMDAFYLSIVAEKLKEYKLTNQVKLYAYDVNEEMFPKGIPAGDGPKHDPTGQNAKDTSTPYPALYIFPAYHKGMPYTRYPQDRPIVSDAILAWIKHYADLKIEYPEDTKGIGREEHYTPKFWQAIQKEGVIQMPKQEKKQKKEEQETNQQQQEDL